MKNIYYSQDVEYFFDKILNDKHFKYARYNDGELIAVIGKSPNRANIDEHQYFPEMTKDLKNALLNYKKSEDYILVSQIGWYNHKPEYKNIVDEITKINPDVKFSDKCFMSHSHYNDPSNFIKFIDLMKTKKVVIVGPNYLGKMKRIFPNFQHIEVPQKNCYLKKKEIIESINNLNKSSNNNYYLFSASMATNAIIDVFKNDTQNTYLDCGAVWDTFFISPEYSFIKKRTPCKREQLKLNEFYKEYLF